MRYSHLIELVQPERIRSERTALEVRIVQGRTALGAPVVLERECIQRSQNLHRLGSCK